MIKMGQCGYCKREFKYDDKQRTGKYCSRKCFADMRMAKVRCIRLESGWFYRISNFILMTKDRIWKILKG